MSILPAFTRCTVKPWICRGDHDSDPSFHLVGSNGKWLTSSFYSDSRSGRATVPLPIQLQFANRQDLDAFLNKNCFHPAPLGDWTAIVDVETTKGKTDTGDRVSEPDAAPAADETGPSAAAQSKPTPRVSIEAKVNLTFGTGHALTATVEGVTIVSCRVLEQGTEADEHSVVLQTEVVICVSRAGEGGLMGQSDLSADDHVDQIYSSAVKIHLEVTAAFWEPSESAVAPDQRMTSPAIGEILDALHIGRQRYRSSTVSNPGGTITRLPPILVQVTVTQALYLQVRSIPGPNPGCTFLAVTIRHSNTHAHNLTITNMAVHPRATRLLPATQQSRLLEATASAEGMTSTIAVPRQYSPVASTVTDMSHSVKWGFLDASTSPQLPLTLPPNGAHSTVLTMDAVSNVDDAAEASRRYCCELSVMATLDGNRNKTSVLYGRSLQLFATAGVNWTTRPVAMEPANALRLNLSLNPYDGTNSTCTSEKPSTESPVIAIVGKPFTVDLDITNLSDQSCQLELVVETKHVDDKDRWEVSSDCEGLQFGIGSPEVGLIHQELLAMDTSIFIEELHAHASTKAMFRIMPLRQGTLTIPNFQLLDRRAGKRYHCDHRLQVVVAAN
jgi:hypothetical protein